MSDRERLLEALRGAGERGVHTFDIRRSGISGNPSERIRELRALGYTIRGEREKVGERWGKRFYLEVDADVGGGTEKGSGLTGGIREEKPAEQPAADVSADDVGRFVEDPDTHCWEWQLARAKGYGRAKTTAGIVQAHRLYYEELVGPIPAGLTLDHLCRNRACVNPGHVEPVTNRENILRGNGPTAQNARKEYCKRGHSLTGSNVYVRPADAKEPGRRTCRACQRENITKRRRKEKNASGREAEPVPLGAGLSSGGVPSTSPPSDAARLFDPPSRWDELQKA